MYFNHQAATRHHPARMQIKVVANGYLITDLIDVKLAHCSWNLGSATAKHYQGGRHRLWIVVSRRHPRTPGSVQFRVVDSAGQKVFVKARV